MDDQPLRVQPLGIGGILDHALILWKQNMVVLLITGVCIFGPLDYAGTRLADFVSASVLEGMASTIGIFPLVLSRVAWDAVLVVKYATIDTLYAAVCIHYLGQRYMGGSGGRAYTSFFDSVRYILRLCFRLVPIHLVYFAVYVALTALCVLPGLAFNALLYLRTPVMVLEDERPIRAFLRAASLVRRQYLVSFAIIAVLTVMGVCAYGMREVPGLGIFLSHALSRVIGTFDYAVVTVFYFSARSLLEHTDLDLLAREVDSDEVDDTPIL